MESGCTVKELMDVGFIAKDLVAAGVDLDDIFGETAPVAVMRAAGISATGIKAEGLTRDWVNQTDWLKEMREAGYTPAELKEAKYTPQELKDVGCKAAELHGCGFNLKQLKTAFGVKELKPLNAFTPAHFQAAGFPAKEMREAGFE